VDVLARTEERGDGMIEAFDKLAEEARHEKEAIR